MTNLPRPGENLLGKYRVERVIGQGGMGVIVAAHHEQLGTPVALKFLRQEILEHAEAVRLFICEARAAIRIKSEHVARIIDVNTLENGTPFIVMEYLEGETLRAFALRQHPLRIEAGVELLLQVCEAMAEAHALGIVHRDLKPANIFVVRRADGLFAAKVLDFGISKANDAALDGAAGSGAATGQPAPPEQGEAVALGSPAYAPPEQIRGESVDMRADVWSLGVILYELASGGTAPFEDNETVRVCSKVLYDEPARLGAEHGVPEGLFDVIERCLRKDREQRFENVAQLAAALAPFAPERAHASIARIVRTVGEAGGRVPALPFVSSAAPPDENVPPAEAAASPGSVGRAWGFKRVVAAGFACACAAAVLVFVLKKPFQASRPVRVVAVDEESAVTEPASPNAVSVVTSAGLRELRADGALGSEAPTVTPALDSARAPVDLETDPRSLLVTQKPSKPRGRTTPDPLRAPNTVARRDEFNSRVFGARK